MAERRRWTTVAGADADHARSSPTVLVIALGVAVATSLLVGLESCSGVHDGDISCDPPPRITSSPPTQATVGQQYHYRVEAIYVCGLGSVCSGDIEAVQLPPGATAGPHSVDWTPDSSQGNRDFRFIIATLPDYCGDRVRQSWVVHVSPAAR